MGFNVGGVRVDGAIVNSITTGKQVAQQILQQQIDDVKADPAKNIREAQQPSGLSNFLDIKI